MVAGITRPTTAEPGNVMERALWGAMFDDDDLVAMYVEVAVVSALTRLVEEMNPAAWEGNRYWAWREHLEKARLKCQRQETEFVKRFETYAEPPF